MVEPRLSLQWFVKMDSLSLEALQTNTEFMPSRFRKIFDTWMTQTFDWCISRQLWWGHRIPAWYKDGEVKVQIEQPADDWVQDEDVLDTWFSSALWPFSTLGYPEETIDYKRYYPTQVLVTGYDIIFFWVARMIFQGRHFTHQDPFEHVLIHGLIRDAQGKKMSKSLGNGVDPMDVMNTYGVDALRYFLTTNSAPGLDMRYDETKVESSWNFLNKLWHVSRYVMMSTTKVDTLDRHLLKPMDKWILHALSQTITDADMYYEKYEFGEAAKVLYTFIWDMYANTYVEYAKVALKEGQVHVSYILRYALETILKLMHPFVPFVTDAIYQELTGLDTLTISDWPVANDYFKTSYDEMELMLDVIKKMRHFRNETQIFKPLTLYYKDSDSKFESMVKAHASFIQTMLKLESIKAITEKELQDMTPLSTTYMTVYVLTSDVIDLEKEKEIKDAQIKMLHLEIERSLKLLNNPSFLEKAHPDKIKLEKEKYDAYQIQLQALKG
jgi:valyl-tRNA synthetase